MQRWVGRAVWVLWVVTCLMVGCGALDSTPCVAVATDVKSHPWRTESQITYTNSDTLALYDMALFLRCSDRFAEDTIRVRVAVETPDSLYFEEPYLLVFVPAHTPAPLAREVSVAYRQQICFAHSGDYRFRITPMRPIQGVEAVGFYLTKSN